MMTDQMTKEEAAIGEEEEEDPGKGEHLGEIEMEEEEGEEVIIQVMEEEGAIEQTIKMLKMRKRIKNIETESIDM
jgi:hypothetical protein